MHPLGWADKNISVDFQGGFINLADFAGVGYAKGLAEMLQPASLERLVSVPLMKTLPDIGGLVSFVTKIVERALD